MVKRAKAVDAKLVWDYETMLVTAADYDALAAQLAFVLKANETHCGMLSEAGVRIRELEAALLDIRNIAYLACDRATQDGADRLAALDRIYALARSQSDRGSDAAGE